MLKMNTSHQRHWIAISYLNGFIEDVRHVQYTVKVQTLVMRKDYGTLVRIKIKVCRYGSWEKFSTHIIRIRTPADICVFQATLHYYKTIIEHLHKTNNSIEQD